MIPDHHGPSRTILDDSVQSWTIPDDPGQSRRILVVFERKKDVKEKIQNVRVTKSKMLVLPNPKCQFYQIQNVSFTKSIMSVLPIQNVSFTKSKMSVLHNKTESQKKETKEKDAKEKRRKRKKCRMKGFFFSQNETKCRG